MKQIYRSLRSFCVAAIVFSLLFTLPESAKTQPASFRDDFSSTTLDPAWTVVQPWPGGSLRPGNWGTYLPANHYSLADHPGYLRYGFDPMTYYEGFLYNYATAPAWIYCCCPMDAGLELHRTFSGNQWEFETMGTFYLPYTNGRGFYVRLYFGTGGVGTYWVHMMRGADVNQNNLRISLMQQTGSGWNANSIIKDYYDPDGWYYGPNNYPTGSIYFRVNRDGGTITASWSDDGTTWNTAWSHDMGTALDGLEQRLVMTGICWFNPAGSYADWDYVSLKDLTPPVAVCQDAILNLDGEGMATLDPSAIDGGSTGNGITLSADKTNFTCEDVSTSPHMVTLTVTDINGNSSTCQAEVTVADMIPPTALCHNITVNLDESGHASITPDDMDGSSEVPVNSEIIPDVNSMLLEHFNGTTSGTPWQPLTYEPGMAGMGQAVRIGPGNWVKYIFPGWQPYCCGNNPQIQGTIEMWVKPDVWGRWGFLLEFNWNNTNSRPQAGHVLYSVGAYQPDPPIPETPWDPEFHVQTWNWERGSLPDALKGNTPLPVNEWIHLAYTWSPSVSKVYLNGVIDGYENANVYPAIGSTVYAYLNEWGGGNYEGLIDELHISKVALSDEQIMQHAHRNRTYSSDACGIASKTLDRYEFTCADVGENTITFTVTDVNGNSSSCEAIVSVKDNIPPSVTCPGDQTVALDGCNGILPDYTSGRATDNCPVTVDQIPAAGTLYDGEQTIVVTLTADDGHGNTESCSFNVFFEDQVPPEVACRDITVQLDSEGKALITPADIDGSGDDGEGTSREIVPDANTVLLDHLNGTTSGTPMGTLNFQPGMPGMGQAAQFAPGNFIKYVLAGWHPYCCNDNPAVQGTIEMWVKAGVWGSSGSLLDINWNNSNSRPTAGHIIYAFGVFPPVQSFFSYHCWNWQRDYLSPWVPGTSAVPAGEWVHLAISWGPSISKVYVNGIVDGVKNVNVYPSFNSTNFAYLNEWGQGTFSGLIDEFHVSKVQRSDAEILAHATRQEGTYDACGIASKTISKSEFTCADIGSNTVILTVTDVNGNSTACEAVVTVEDNVHPVAICQPVMVQLDETGHGSTTAALVNNGSSDNCGIASMTLDNYDFTCADVGENTITFTVTDVNGNSSSCEAVVTVEDNVDPDITCIPSTFQYVDPYQTYYTVIGAEFDASANDACEVASLMYACATASATSGTTLAGVKLQGVGIHTITWTAVDKNGNNSDCTTLVEVKKRPTTLTYKGDLTVQYTDVADLSAKLVDVDGNPVAGKTIRFDIGTQWVSAVTLTNGIAATTLKIDQAPGTYNVISTFTEDESYLGSSDSDPFTIEPEIACGAYNGPIFVNTSGPEVYSVRILLSVVVTQDADGSLIGIDPASNINFAFNASSDPANNVSLVGSPEYKSATSSFEQYADVTIKYETVSTIVDIKWTIGGYFTNSGCDEQQSIVTVARPTTDYSAGGGYLVLTENSEGLKEGMTGTKNNFGYNIKWGKNYSKLVGNFNTIWRQEGVAFQARSNSASALIISPIAGTDPVKYKAQITYSNVNMRQFDCLWNCWSEGNGTIILTVIDWGEPGSNGAQTDPDEIGIAVRSKNGVLVYSSNTYTASNQDPITVQDLDGGNTQVKPANSSAKSAEAVNGLQLPERTMLVVYPNPFAEKLKFEFITQVDAHARINLYDVTGQMVSSIFDNKVKAGIYYNAEFIPSAKVSGMYFYRMTLGKEMFNGKAIYQQ